MPLDPFGQSEGLDLAKPVAGADPFAPDPNAPGPFKRGLGAGIAGVRSNLAGAGALVAHAVGAADLERAALAKAQAESEVAAAQNQNIEQVDWASPASIFNHFKWLLGNAVPSLATMAGGAIAGRGLGALAGRAAPASAAALTRAGTFAGAVAPDVALEAGGIYPEALKTGVEDPALRAAVGGAAAASLDFIPLLAAEKYLTPVGKGGFGALLKGAAKGAPVGAGLEGAQELAQSIVERAAAGHSLTDPEAVSDYINSFAGGAAPGLLFGAGIGMRRGSAAPAPVQPPPVSTVGGQAPEVNTPLPTVADLGDTTAASLPSVEGLNAPTEVVPPLSTGVENPVSPVATYDRNVSPVAQDADWTMRETLQQQQAQATEKLAALDAELKLPAKERRAEDVIRGEALQTAMQQNTVTQHLATVEQSLKTRRLLSDTPAAPIAERTDQPRAVTIGGEQVPETRAAEAAVAAVKRGLGMLVSSREAKLVPVQEPTVRGLALEKSHSRSVATTPSEKTRQGAMEAVLIESVQPIVKAVVGAKNLKGEGPAKAEKAITNALNSVVQEAAAKPTTEEAQAHIAAEVPKALKGRVAVENVDDIVKMMSAAATQAHTLYSKGAKASIADLSSVPLERLLRMEKQVGDDYVAGKMTHEEFMDRADPLIQARVQAEVREQKLKNAGVLKPVFPGFNRIPEGVKVRASYGTTYANAIGTVVGSKTVQLTDGLYMVPKVDFGDGRARSLTPTDIHEVYAPRLAQSRAALSQEEFNALPEPAKQAALDAYNEVLRVKGTELRNHLKQLAGDDPNLVVKTFQANPDSPIGSYTRVDKLKSVIALAVNAKDGMSLADHEGFHYLEDRVLTSAERQIIANAVKEGRPVYKQLLEKVQQYDRENKTNLSDEVASTPAEARAYAFEFWRRGELKAEGALNRVFQIIRDLLDKVSNFVNGLGFQSIEDIFRAMDRGQFAERAQNPEGAFGEGSMASEAGGSPWYKSALLDSVTAMPTKAASPQGWKEQISGLVKKGAVKQAEIDAVGLNEFLDLQKGKVTKDQVVSFLKENGVQVKETELGGESTNPASVRENDDGEWEVVNEQTGYALDLGTYSTQERAQNAADDWWDQERRIGDSEARKSATKFHSYQLPGGENYRELLLTLPTAEQAEYNKLVADGVPLAEAHNRVAEKHPHFQSSHFDQPNILAHIRFNERTDASGARVLFIEELQSDWAQKGKKEGFTSAAPEGRYTIVDSTHELVGRHEYHTAEQAMDALDGIRNAATSLNREYTNGMMIVEAVAADSKAPSAPFVTKTEAWVGLSLKRMIRYAAENGFDKVAWTTGEQQAARYDLSKHLDSIGYSKRGELYNVTAFGKGGGAVWSDQSATLQSIEDHLGKEIASKIQKGEGRSEGPKQLLKYLEGLDLKVGGEGMKAFYDKIVPNVANDVLKKLGGGRVEELNLGDKMKRDTYVTKTNSATWQVYDKLSDTWLGHSLESWVSTPIEAREFRNEGDAMRAATKLQDMPSERNQPGFTVTPELARRAAEGLPLFSRAAVDIARRFEAGELEREQLNQAIAGMIDRANLSAVTAKQALGAIGEQTLGSLQRWRLKNIATGNYVSRFSKGYANVQKTLLAYVQRKSTLIAQGSLEQLSSWHESATSQPDITAVGKVLLTRTERGLSLDDPELTSMLATLTEHQRQMFRQATTMIAGRLQHEFDVEQRTMATILPAAEYEKWFQNRSTQVQKLIAEGYVPERRYGDYTVHITLPNADPTKKALTVHYEQFENQAAADVQAQRYKEVLAREAPELQVDVGYRYKAERDASISIQQFFDTARRNGIELTQTERERLAKALVSADSLRRNRIFRRKNVSGYSEDIMRVLHEFVVTTANKVAYSEFATPINDALDGKPVDARTENGVPKSTTDATRNLWKEDGPQSGFFRNLSDELSDYVLVPDHSGEWSRKLRGAAMTYFIGGSIASGVVNAMSIPMNVVPWLSQATNYTNAFTKTFGSTGLVLKNLTALRDLPTLKNLDHPIPEIDAVPGLRAALITAAEDGRTMDTEIHQIMGMAQGASYAQSRRVQKAMDVWMAPFKLTEQINRIATFTAAYRVGLDNHLAGRDLYEFAAGAVDNTQNRYDEVNRPGLARDPMWALLFMFKSFPLFMVEMVETLFRQNPKSAVYMLLGLTAMTGVQGLPFAETIQDLIDTIAQRIFGSPFNSRRAMRNLIKDASEAIVGADLSEVVLRGGINSLTGMSLSSRIGMGDFLPGTRIGAADNDYGRTAEQILGAPFSMVTGVASSAGKVMKGDFLEALRAGGPVALRNLIKGGEQLDRGYAMDARGQKLVNATGPEAFWQSLGFSSAALNKAYEMDKIDRQELAFYTQVRNDFMGHLVKALKDGDAASAQETFEMMRAWNEAYPTMPIMLTPATVRRDVMMAGMPLNARTLRMLPRQLRGSSVAAEGIGQ